MRKLKDLIESRAQALSARVKLFGTFNSRGKRSTYAGIAQELANAIPAGISRDSYDDVEAYKGDLEQAGYEVLGCGHFSIVVSHPAFPDIAFKASIRKEDSGVAYAAYCRANPGRHIPVIHHMEMFKSCTVIVMPKYRPLGWSEEYDGPYYAAVDGLYGEPASNKRSEAVAAAAIRKYFKGSARFDLHRQNAMWDEVNDCLILTDPVSFKSED